MMYLVVLSSVPGTGTVPGACTSIFRHWQDSFLIRYEYE
jgi:hypothetical protein